MSRYREGLCRLCRREGTKLFLKGDRCLTEKCAIERRAYAPGQHGQRRTKLTEYAIQLREKQKARRVYGMVERQFRKTFHNAERRTGITGEIFLQLLERRLDSVLYRLGFAVNRRQGRQLVGHGHILVKGRKVTIPSFVVKKGDVIEVASRSRKLKHFTDVLERRAQLKLPSWLSIAEGELKGTVLDDPKAEDIAIPVRESMVVEFYSK